jgi:hypothetical protein
MRAKTLTPIVGRRAQIRDAVVAAANGHRSDRGRRGIIGKDGAGKGLARKKERLARKKKRP